MFCVIYKPNGEEHYFYNNVQVSKKQYLAIAAAQHTAKEQQNG